MLLRGFAIDGSIVPFTLEDAPIVLTDTLLALSAVSQSKLICLDTVGRGDEELKVFEGDEVVDEDGTVLGIIYYSKGFKVHNIDTPLKNLLSDGHIQVREGTSQTTRAIASLSDRTDIMFGYNKKIIFFRSILARIEGYLAFVDDDRRISAVDIRFFTGHQTKKGESIFFGDFHCGGTVVLRDGVPCVKKLSGKWQGMEE